MLTVHHLRISQSERIVWLCEELGIPYELKAYDRDATTRLAPDAYRALHPLGTAPIITDGDLVLAESAAIMAYIIAKHGGGQLAVAPDEPGYADYLFWFHFGNGSLMPGRIMDLVAAMLGEGMGALGDAMQARNARMYAMMNVQLGKTEYLAGDAFTAADIISVFPLTTMRMFAPLDLSPYPNIQAYLKRIGARPAYQAAMAKGDPGMTPMLD